MGKSGKKKNGYGTGTFIEARMFLSEAYLSLGQPGSCPSVSSVSVQILTMLLGKRQFGEIKDHKGRKVKERVDDNKFTLTYKEITSYGSRIDKNGNRVKGTITQPKATRAIDELLAKGFIKIAEYGGAYEKHKSKYSLVDDWKNWKAGDTPIRSREKDRRRGYQGKGLGAVKTDYCTHERCTPTHT